MKYKYVCSDGTKGWTEAPSDDECLKKMLKTGMNIVSIHKDAKDGLELVWEEPKPQTQEMIDVPEPPTAQPAVVPPHVVAQARAISDGIIPIQAMREPNLAPPVTERDLKMAAAPKRRQSFSMGPYEQVRGFIEQNLNRNGTVLHVAVNSDIKGNLIVAIVIEHDDYGKD